MTKAEKLLKEYGYNATPMLLDILQQCMEVGFDNGVKMSHIRKDSLIKQWFEDDPPSMVFDKETTEQLTKGRSIIRNK
ncbi:hypothetical protein UFOVP129_3 [uncultured Caudovirales phage]|uniref:Uncharacterized protein n=1 Tax=uncultured Caudovirales phage TaxID=2100421 RepID=A0A6J5LC66_9CAUD|nr:hypothetical protein UFOVP129_3 [uncultured Caudovirales phage]